MPRYSSALRRPNEASRADLPVPGPPVMAMGEVPSASSRMTSAAGPGRFCQSRVNRATASAACVPAIAGRRSAAPLFEAQPQPRVAAAVQRHVHRRRKVRAAGGGDLPQPVMLVVGAQLGVGSPRRAPLQQLDQRPAETPPRSYLLRAGGREELHRGCSPRRSSPGTGSEITAPEWQASMTSIRPVALLAHARARASDDPRLAARPGSYGPGVAVKHWSWCVAD